MKPREITVVPYRGFAPRSWMAAAFLVSSIPLVVLVYQVNRYGVNLPFSDQWGFVGFIKKSMTTGLALSDYFAQHGEQRMAFPRMVMMALARMTSWNIRVELFTNLVLAAAIFAGLLVLFASGLQAMGRWGLVIPPALSLMIFSAVQWENWFWGWQISWFLPLAAMILTVCVLSLWPQERPAWPAVVVAAAAAFVGQYSLLSGTLIWVVCVPIFLFRKSFRRWLVVWLPLAAAGTAAYLYGYTTPEVFERTHHVPVSTLWEHPRESLAYLLYLLGRPVLDERPGYLAGALSLLLFGALTGWLLLLRRDRFQQALPWIAIGFYAVAAAVTTMLGRMRLGLVFAGSSRYTTVGILLMVATLGLATALVGHGEASRESRRPSLKPGAAAAAWVFVAGLFLADYPSEIRSMMVWHNERAGMKACLQSLTSPQDPCLSGFNIPAAFIYESVGFLREAGWSDVGIAGKS